MPVRNWNGSKWIRPEKRLAIYLRDRFTCSYCGVDLRDKEPAEVSLDHLKPFSKGGTNEATNLVTACRSCNCGRGDKPWRQYATPGAIERIQRRRRRVLNIALAKAIIAGDVNPVEVVR